MALSKLSGDEQGIILGQLRNPLEPRLAMYFSSASTELRLLLTPAVQQQLKADHEVAAALCVKMGMESCEELREATEVSWENKGLSAADLATLGLLGSMLPALETLSVADNLDVAGPDGVPQLAAGLGAGALPAVAYLDLGNMHVGNAGASALAAALDRGALPRLEVLTLGKTDIGNAGLVALAPALRRLPALECLYLYDNPFGDEGLAALVAPPPPAGALPLPTGGLKKLELLDLDDTQVSDAGCAALATALDSGALPALVTLALADIHASAAARDAVSMALAKSRAAALCVKCGMKSCKELREARVVHCDGHDLSEADLATLCTLVLPALESLRFRSGSAGPDGVPRLAEALTAGALPALTLVNLEMHMGDAGASAIAAALDQGALPRLRALILNNADIGDAGLVALAPALRRRPALEYLFLLGSPFGDEGLAALVAPPPPPAGVPPLPTGGLKKLRGLDLGYTQVSGAGCAALAAALDSGALPALEHLMLTGIPASAAATDAVREALERSRAAAIAGGHCLTNHPLGSAIAASAARELGRRRSQRLRGGVGGGVY
jgi:hypothetical protein